VRVVGAEDVRNGFQADTFAGSVLARRRLRGSGFLEKDRVYSLGFRMPAELSALSSGWSLMVTKTRVRSCAHIREGFRDMQNRKMSDWRF
jgi:hypothetical protein